MLRRGDFAVSGDYADIENIFKTLVPKTAEAFEFSNLLRRELSVFRCHSEGLKLLNIIHIYCLQSRKFKRQLTFFHNIIIIVGCQPRINTCKK